MHVYFSQIPFLDENLILCHLYIIMIYAMPGLYPALAEREGFEPSMELLAPYSLSRGAPSAARPSLLRLFLKQDGLRKDWARVYQNQCAKSSPSEQNLMKLRLPRLHRNHVDD